MRAHAILSASGAHRWLNCPPSARLEQKFPDRAGASAEEGTFAHKWAEMALAEHFGKIASGDYKAFVKKARKSQWYSQSLSDYADEYINMVIDKVEDCDGKLMLEQRLDFSQWVPQGFGSGDAVIIGRNRIEVCDLKFGKSVPVVAEDNPQLRLYGLGAYSIARMLGIDVEEVQMTICQPRNGGISTEILSVSKLLKWGDAIKPIAQQAMAGLGEPQPGEWCRFCKAVPRCRKLAEHNLMCEDSFDDPALMEDEELARLLAKADMVKSYVTKLKDYAYAEALNGREWPGWKLVEGRANRKYRNEETIAIILNKNGYADSQIFKPKALIGLTDMQKLLGRKNFDALLGDEVIRPEGAPVLVPESDKRPAINEAESYFEDLDEKG